MRAAERLCCGQYVARHLDHRPVGPVGGESLQDSWYALGVECPVGHAAPQRTAHFHRQNGGNDAAIPAKQLENLSTAQFFDVALDQRARVEIRVVLWQLRAIVAIVDDRLREWLSTNRHRLETRQRSQARRQSDEALVRHLLEDRLGFERLFDWLDDGDRLTTLGQDDLLARANGLDGLREVLVGFPQPELHVVMLLQLQRTAEAD